jgi:hypothetical protein
MEAALLVDTAMCMKRTFGREPIVLISTSASETATNANMMTISSLFQSASSFWSPTVLKIATSRVHGRWIKQQQAENGGGDEVAIAHWDVTCTSDNDQDEKQAEYCVLRNLDHEQRIVYAAACCQKKDTMS